MTDDFTWWTNALAGNRGPIHAEEPQSGFYRQRRQDKTYEPVAYWRDSATGELRCHVNGRSVTGDRMITMWPYVSKHPVTAEMYWDRLDNGIWPDDDAAAVASAAGPDIDPEQDPVGSAKAEIEKARAGLRDYKTIDSDEQSAKAQTLRSALTALAGKADKARTAEKEPHLKASRDVDAKWQPIVKLAKEGADDIRRAMATWEDIKRENYRRAQLAAEKAARDAQEAGKPAPPPPATNTPPPSTQIKGASGRAASVGTKKVVTAIDLDKAIAQFRDEPELYAFLMNLSQRVVDSGFVAIGATIEEKSTVR